MYLMMLTNLPEDELEAGMEALSGKFKEQIQSINRTSRETARDSNPTAALLACLFKAWKTAQEMSVNYLGRSPDPEQEFIQRYQIRFDEDGSLKNVLSRDLFVALKRVSREFGLRFDMESSRQFAQRFANDLETIKGAGFDIVISVDHRGTKIYSIKEK